MNLARVVGRLWTIRKLPELEGLKVLFHLPIDLKDGRGVGPALVAADSRRAGEGELLHYVPSQEASFHFDREYAALDTAIAGHVERIDL